MPHRSLPSPAGDLLHDWNGAVPLPVPIGFDDETLRDGLQSPSARVPSAEEALAFLEVAAGLGIGAADVGFPGSSRQAAAAVEEICRGIAGARLPVAPNCAARTVEADIVPILEIAGSAGIPVEVAMFTASSALRCHIEGWSLDEVLRRTERCIGFAVAHGAPVTFVTEDTTRCQPERLEALFRTAVAAGATRVCVADTVGYATPAGAAAVVRFVRRVLDEAGGAQVGLDWHGHNDRGLAVANAMAAAVAGASRLHATALGIGERVGNAPMEQLLANARLAGWIAADLARLHEYTLLASEILALPIAPGQPLVGSDAFRTATGVHAAAIAKADRMAEPEMAELVYAALPASWIGRGQEIAVGPMSGAANVRVWLRAHGYLASQTLVERVLAAAKGAGRVLLPSELHALARR